MIDLTVDLAKEGAKDALTLLIQSRKRPIKSKANSDSSDSNKEILKMPKNAEIVDVDEEEKEQDEAEGKESETEEERKTRVSQVARDNSEDEVKKDISQIKADSQAKEAEKKRRLIAKQAEADKFLKSSQPADFSDFSTSLRKAISQQIGLSRNPEETYSRSNPSYAGSDLLMPGSTYVDKKEIPVINIYFDKSGSLSSKDVKRGKDAISVINGFQRQKKVKYKLYWFGDKVVDDSSENAGSGTRAFPKIIEHIQETKATNVIIFTDDDFDHQTPDMNSLPVLKLKGCVWWIWSKSIAKRAAKHIVGARPNSTFEFML